MVWLLHTLQPQAHAYILLLFYLIPRRMTISQIYCISWPIYFLENRDLHELSWCLTFKIHINTNQVYLVRIYMYFESKGWLMSVKVPVCNYKVITITSVSKKLRQSTVCLFFFWNRRHSCSSFKYIPLKSRPFCCWSLKLIDTFISQI